MRFSSIVVVLGAVSCTLGTAIPANEEAAATIPAANSATDTTPAPNSKPLGTTPGKEKATAAGANSGTDTTPGKEPKPLTPEIKKKIEEAAEDEKKITGFWNSVKSGGGPLEKDVLPHPNAASADSNGVGEPTEKAVSSDPNAASPDSNTPKRSPKLLRRLDRTSAVLENIKDNKDALKIADRNISKWNREIGTCNIQLNRINGLIRWHESAQYETPQIQDEVASLEAQYDQEDRLLTAAFNEKEYWKEARTIASNELWGDYQYLKALKGAAYLRLPGEIKEMIKDQAYWTYVNDKRQGLN